MRHHLCFLLTITCLLAQDDGEGPRRRGPEPVRLQARSLVMTKYGIVATSQSLASAAGAKVLEAGGNAIDAAIAANATLGLVEPTGNGMGGDLFAIIYEAKTGRLYGLNSSGWAPSGMTIDLLESKGFKKVPGSGIFSVTVPGAVAGWDAMHRKFGKLPFRQLFAPAMHYAEAGYPVTELISQRWQVEVRKLKSPEASRLWMPGGKAPQPGQVLKNPELAKSLLRVATEGRDGFYKGPIAEAILNASSQEGGTFTAADLADFQPEWIEPISTTYRGWTATQLPPNGQGVAVLSMLNIMERFPLAEYGHNSVKALHVMIEAKKLAYADMLKYTGDPRTSTIPVAAMISKELAEKHATKINPGKATCTVTPAELMSMARLPGADTIYMTTIDAEGNMVSLIQSNFGGFGSGVVPPGTGFMLQNRASLFTLERDHPNSLAPHKRPLHTIIPGFLSKGDTRISFGIMGGWNQAQAHAQFIANIVDYGMNIQAALEAPRFTKGSFDGCDVSIESRVDPAVLEGLKALGHELRISAPYSPGMGGGQAVMSNGEGVHFGASDPRKDGEAIPESPRFWQAKR